MVPSGLFFVMRHDFMGGLFFVTRNDFVGGAEHFHAAVLEPHGDLAHPSHVRHSMTDQNRGVSFIDNLFHAIEAFLLEHRISYRQHFVENDNLRIQVGRDRKGQSNIHPAGVIFHWNIDELLQSGEFHDLIEPFAHFFSGKPKHGSVQVNVIPTGKFGMKTGPNFQETRQAPVHFHGTGRRLGDP